MALLGDDCFFYYKSGCARGNLCAFRHQPAAKNTTTSCPEWLKGSCYKPTCVLRHMIVEMSQTKARCRWDTAPSGCLDTNCKYLHANKKPVQLPTTTSAPPTVRPAVVSTLFPSAPTVKKFTGVHPLVNNNTIIPGPVPMASPVIKPVIRVAANVAPPQGPILIRQPNIVKVTPQLIAQVQQPQLVNIPGPQLPTPIIHAPAANGLPKPVLPNVLPNNSFFNQQVQQFKDLLASKNKTVSGGESGNYGDRRDKHKEKQRHKRREKHGPKSSKIHRSKLSKADEEILFGDYKDIPLGDEWRSDRDFDSEPEVRVKSYDQILREKALRKCIVKRRKDFDNDFKVLTSDNKNPKKIQRESYSDDEQHKDRKRRRVKTVIDIENEVFNKEDAVELGLDESPIREQIHDEPPRPKKKPKKSIVIPEEDEEAGVIEEVGQMIIPDETTDINFSVDDNDELAKELNQVEQEGDEKKIASSIVNIIHKRADYPDKKKKIIRICPSPPSKSKENTEHKRKVVTVSDCADKLSVKTFSPKGEAPIVSEKKEKKLVQKTGGGRHVKVKSFDEIMAEKRKRRNVDNKDTQVDCSPTEKQVVDPLLEKSVKAKSELRGSQPTVVTIVSPVKKIGPLRRLKRSSSCDEEEKSKRRKSAQLYRPPTSTKNVKSAVKPKAKKLVKIVKPAGDNEAVIPTAEANKSIGIRSFEEIMQEKRLRCQQAKEQHNQQLVPNADVQAQRKHRFIKRPVGTSSLDGKTMSVVPIVKPVPNESPIARVQPMQINHSAKDDDDDTSTSVVPRLSRSPVAQQNTSSNIANKNSVVPQMKGELKEANIELKTQDSKHAKENEEEVLFSDEEFDKEINDLSDGDDEHGDIDADELIMELEEMIGSN